MEVEALKTLIMTVLDQHKAENIWWADVSPASTIFDGIVLASATNPRHVRALAGYLVEMVRKNGHTVIGVEGEKEGSWVLVDCGEIVVHLMLEDIRSYYDVESLWSIQNRLARSPQVLCSASQSSNKAPA